MEIRSTWWICRVRLEMFERDGRSGVCLGAVCMVTRKQYKHATGYRTREEFAVGSRI